MAGLEGLARSMANAQVKPSDKLQTLAESEGYKSVNDMLESRGLDSGVPAICMNAGCDYTSDMEPDQNGGYCEVCKTNSVQSCLVLAGVI